MNKKSTTIYQELSNAGAILPDDKICERAKLDTGTFCNYKCYFCYYKTQLNLKTSFDTIKQRIDKLYELGCRDFDLSGGESSIHPDFLKILQYLRALNVKVSCLSNGYKFSDFGFLKECYDTGLSEILFSLHSVGETHDEIVGKNGAFKKIIQAIMNAKELNILIRFNSTITSKNYNLIGTEYFRLVEEFKPFEMNFLPLNYFSDNKKSELIDYNIILNPIKRFIDKTSIKLTNVRYVPFCYMRNYEKNVVGYFQHIYDLYDWNIAYYEYLKPTKENLKKQAGLNRALNYKKGKECMKCKYFYICDGIEYQLNLPFYPILSDQKIRDVNHFRKEFFSFI